MSDGQKIVIIGAVACGAKAASRIRRLDPKAEIVMLDQGRFISYAGCGLPYYVEGKVREFEDLVKTTYGRVRDADYFRDLKGVDTRVGVRAEAIDREKKIVRARELASGDSLEFPYDRLVLAMGAAPSRPPIEGIDLDGVFNLTRMEDAAAVRARVDATPGGSAVIIGAGFIGIEAAEALGEKRWEVALIERFGQVFPKALDFEMAALIQEHLYEHMIEPELNANVLRIEGEDGKVTKVVTEEGETDADLVILAAGVRPNSDLARDAGLEVGASGGLIVNDRLQTSDPEIYAGGDLVENRHLVLDKPWFTPLGSTANKHGRVIGDNICGLDSTFPGILGTFVCKVFDYNVGATGLTETAAREAGLDVYCVTAPGFDKAHYYPDSQIMALKYVIDRESDRLLGAQVVGRGDVARRVDVAATAITFGATIGRIANLDLAYAPPFSQAMDVILTAANVAKNAKSGALRKVTPFETRRMLEEREDVVLVDVRAQNEYLRAHIDDPKVVNIPLDELGARMGELPRDKEILCLCLLGLRGFTAQRMLESAGYERVGTVEGGMFVWPWKDELA